MENRRRQEFATQGFLTEMRRQFAMLHPDQPCPIKPLAEYPPAERSALIAAVRKAVSFADPSMDEAFKLWTEREQSRREKT